MITYPHRVPSPRPQPPRRATALSRRTALLGAVGTAAVGCSPYELQTQRRRPARPTASADTRPETDPDVALATTVVAAERALLERVDATVRRHPRLERVLAATRAVHDAHVALLEDAVPDEDDAEPDDPGATGLPGPEVEPDADTEADPEAEPTTPRVPRDAARAVRALATAEDELVLAAKQAAFAAQSGAFARVLASLAAAAAQQSATLRTVRVRGRRR